jgi:hypothetical protein
MEDSSPSLSDEEVGTGRGGSVAGHYNFYCCVTGGTWSVLAHLIPFGSMEMDTKTRDRIIKVYERLAEDRRELITIRDQLEKEEESFVIVMAWISVLTGITWLGKLVTRT